MPTIAYMQKEVVYLLIDNLKDASDFRKTKRGELRVLVKVIT